MFNIYLSPFNVCVEDGKLLVRTLAGRRESFLPQEVEDVQLFWGGIGIITSRGRYKIWFKSGHYIAVLHFILELTKIRPSGILEHESFLLLNWWRLPKHVRREARDILRCLASR